VYPPFWRYPTFPNSLKTPKQKNSTSVVSSELYHNLDYQKNCNNDIILPLQKVKLYGLMGSGVLENWERWETPKRSRLEVNSYSNHYLNCPSREFKIES